MKEFRAFRVCSENNKTIGRVENLNIDIDIQNNFEEENIVDSYIEHLNSIVETRNINDSISTR